jgi:hypothetical protein
MVLQGGTTDMKVRQLIALLEELDEDAEVYLMSQRG